jgi:hypothetical protein
MFAVELCQNIGNELGRERAFEEKEDERDRGGGQKEVKVVALVNDLIDSELFGVGVIVDGVLEGRVEGLEGWWLEGEGELENFGVNVCSRRR